MGDVLVANAGSTSLKLSLVDERGDSRPLASLDDAPPDVEAVGHRIVHGGGRLVEPTLLDDAAIGELRELSTLAPLHNGPALDVVERARAALPRVPHVAVLDTAFHATIPDEAHVYPVPEAWRARRGVRRYGFHGISVAWSVGRAAALAGAGAPPRRLVVCHLGGGASATAVLDGRSVDTSMGFGPNDGLVMATRAGSLDPEVVLHLVGRAGLSAHEVERALNSQSGLLALAGRSDMREVERAAAGGDPGALLALRVYDHRLAAVVAGMAAALGGLDAIAFTGGVGEGSPRVRREAASRLGFLGVRVDEALNDGVVPDADIAPAGAPVRALVIRAREDLMIARDVRSLLRAMPAHDDRRVR
jgi:acetate kinase